ncbi:hypothetical protein [[Haemophilus] ducreyi]|nr:hypothetical protein [[Haemophilus] ducreyi]
MPPLEGAFPQPSNWTGHSRSREAGAEDDQDDRPRALTNRLK